MPVHPSSVATTQSPTPTPDLDAEPEAGSSKLRRFVYLLAALGTIGMFVFTAGLLGLAILDYVDSGPDPSITNSGDGSASGDDNVSVSRDGDGDGDVTLGDSYTNIYDSCVAMLSEVECQQINGDQVIIVAPSVDDDESADDEGPDDVIDVGDDVTFDPEDDANRGDLTAVPDGAAEGTVRCLFGTAQFDPHDPSVKPYSTVVGQGCSNLKALLQYQTVPAAEVEGLEPWEVADLTCWLGRNGRALYLETPQGWVRMLPQDVFEAGTLWDLFDSPTDDGVVIASAVPYEEINSNIQEILFEGNSGTLTRPNDGGDFHLFGCWSAVDLFPRTAVSGLHFWYRGAF